MSDLLARLTTALADRYRIERELGAGGMATVYLAEDLKHQRQVAIKVLKPELAAVLGGERFVQEITTTAQLQHPHILPLFDSGTADGFLFYVMPYIEGETLREKLDRETQLGVDEAVRIAREVADALDYAHRNGVIHRDIKPENILLHDGRPVVADFGIALAVSAAAGGRMTETGTSIGTPHYMSPEQATGDKQITGRADIYSLASVLYEMLAGEPPHSAGSAQAVIMKIIAATPKPVSELRKSVPPNVTAAVMQALEKLPADRFESAKAFADALADVHFSTATASGALPGGAVTVRRLTRHPLVLVLAAALVATAGFAVSQWRAAHREAPRPVVRLKIALPSAMLVTNSALGTNVAVSPDGSVVAYARVDSTGTSRLYLRPLSQGDADVIAGTDGAQQPCFSPDGQWIAYVVGTTVWKIQRSGGAPVRIGDAETASVGISWSASGVIIVGALPGLVVFPQDGGASRLLAAADTAAGEIFRQPLVLPDGKTALFTIQPPEGLAQTRLAEVTLETGAVRRFDVTALDVLGYVDGTLVSVMPSGALMGVPFDLNGGTATGAPVTLGPIVGTTLAGATMSDMSPTGTLAYEPANREGTLGWVDPSGRFTPVLSKPEAYGYPRLSPDGKRIAVAVGTEGRSDVLLYDLASGTPTRITNSGTQNDRPEWTPDGRRVLYRSDRSGLYVDLVAARGPERAGGPLAGGRVAQLLRGRDHTGRQDPRLPGRRWGGDPGRRHVSGARRRHDVPPRCGDALRGSPGARIPGRTLGGVRHRRIGELAGRGATVSGPRRPGADLGLGRHRARVGAGREADLLPRRSPCRRRVREHGRRVLRHRSHRPLSRHVRLRLDPTRQLRRVAGRHPAAHGPDRPDAGVRHRLRMEQRVGGADARLRRSMSRCG